MNEDIIYVKQGDTPTFRFYLEHINTAGEWEAFPLAGRTVHFYMSKLPGDTAKVNQTMTVEDEPTALVSYTATAADMSDFGRHYVEVEVREGATLIATFPSNGYRVVEIVRQLA